MADRTGYLAAPVRVIPITASTLAEIAAQSDKEVIDVRFPVDNSVWEYLVGPGDVLNIVVWDHPQLTIPAGPERSPQEAGNWVGADGTIFYPYIGVLSVAGKTVGEVRENVASGLRNVIPNPQVDVSVARFNSQVVQIAGAVASPGVVRLNNIAMTLAEAIERREGLLPDADIRRIKLIRDGTEYSLNYRLFTSAGSAEQNPVLHGGDMIVVPKLNNNDIYVLGEVGRPQAVNLHQDMLSLTKALALSEGINKTTADASGVFVFRFLPADEAIIVYQLDIRDPTALILGTQFQLNKGDVVYVTSAPATRWGRVIANLVPSLNAINTLLFIEDRT